MSLLTGVITASGRGSATARSMPCAASCRSKSCSPSAQALDRFRRTSDNLYERVRALFFLYAIHRFHLPLRARRRDAARRFRSRATRNLLKRRFEEAIDLFLAAQAERGPSDAISSALAAGYHVARLPDAGRPGAPQRAHACAATSGCSASGHPADHPLRLRPELLARGADGAYPDPARDARPCAWT